MASRTFNKAFSLDFPQHKRAQIEDKSQDTLQVIGAGLPGCGTSSLKAALETLGFNPCHHMSADLVDHPQKSLLFADLVNPQLHLSPVESESRLDRIRLYMRGYLATVDSPCCDIYQDLTTLYPKAKVILSVRDSDEAWWRSFSGTLAVQETKRYQWLTYPIPFLRCSNILSRAVTKRWMRLARTNTLGPSIHRVHNKDVQSNVPSEKLLVFNVKMGWKPLCEFLDVPIPDEPFPNLNDAATISRAMKGAQIMGVCVWLLYLGLAILLLVGCIWPRSLLSLVWNFPE